VSSGRGASSAASRPAPCCNPLPGRAHLDNARAALANTAALPNLAPCRVKVHLAERVGCVCVYDGETGGERCLEAATGGTSSKCEEVELQLGCCQVPKASTLGMGALAGRRRLCPVPRQDTACAALPRTLPPCPAASPDARTGRTLFSSIVARSCSPLGQAIDTLGPSLALKVIAMVGSGPSPPAAARTLPRCTRASAAAVPVHAARAPIGHEAAPTRPETYVNCARDCILLNAAVPELARGDSLWQRFAGRFPLMRVLH
jgi:hypothetical protein